MQNKYHDEDGVVTREEQLNCTVGETNGSHLDPDEPAQVFDVNTADYEQSDDSDGGKTSTTNHYQRLQRAEHAWSKLREGALATTFENQASWFDESCQFCESETGVCRCLDFGPLVSSCKSCAVARHARYNIFQRVEILSVSLPSKLCNFFNVMLK